MKIQLLIPNDNFQALYVDGKLVAEGHSIGVEEAVGAVTGEAVEVVDIEDFEDDEYEMGVEDDPDYPGKQVDRINGAVVWINGEGCPTEWPFED